MHVSSRSHGAAALSPHHIAVRRAIVVQEPVQRACAQVRHLIVQCHAEHWRRKRVRHRAPLGRRGATHNIALWQGHVARRRPRAAAPGAGGVRAAIPGSVATPPASSVSVTFQGADAGTLRQRRPWGGTCASTGTAHLLVSASNSAALLIVAAREPQAEESRCAVRLEEAALEVPPQHLRPHPFEEYVAR